MISRQPSDRFHPAVGLHPGQSTQSCSRSWQNQEVWRIKPARLADVADGQVRHSRQRCEVGEIANAGQTEHGHFYLSGSSLDRRQTQGIFFIKLNGRIVGKNAEHRPARPLAHLLQTGVEQGGIATKLVDQEAGDAGSFLLFQKLPCPDQLSKDPTPFNIGYQNDDGVGMVGHAHVDQIVIAQVDFGRAPGAFQDDGIIVSGQPAVRFRDGSPGLGLESVIIPNRHDAGGLSLHDYLAIVIQGFEQDRVHIGGRLEIQDFGLGRLTAGNFLSLKRDKTVERHVLSFEGRDAQALFLEPSAKSRRQHALAGVGAGALDHERFGHWLL